MKIAICDFDTGNLFSLKQALSLPSENEVRIESDPKNLFSNTDLVVLPGVGSFGYAMRSLSPIKEQIAERAENGFPIMGICLGMQLLFEESEESNGVKGLSVIGGKVRKLKSKRLPQIGWNSVGLFRGESESPFKGRFYFANGYVCEPKDSSSVLAQTTYDEDTFCSVVEYKNVIGLQFHPEKSSRIGVDVLNQLAKRLVDRSKS